ncbi:MAG TPA: PD-(D/E)XK nuclease family protein [Acidimicrobiales bacterium]|nr:PD-(D/E)XK nuclease family protein [Acidimicrobiales bacterium]
MALAQPMLNPAQQHVLDVLAAKRDERPVFEADLGSRLRAQLEDGLSSLVPVLDTLGIDRLFVNKHKVSSVLGCEVRFLAEDEIGFEGWTVPIARGTVAHRAIELSMNMRGDPVPAELVDHALANLTEGQSDGLAEWLQSISELERADLRGQALNSVCAFLESWPPLHPRFRPRAESKVSVELLDGRIRLTGKVDLTLGVADGLRAGKVLIDLKTGGFSPVHLDDLRFYALVEAVVRGVPPRRVATYYLESAKPQPEDITVPLLQSAAERVVGAVDRWVALRTAAVDPVRKPGPVCRWCPVLASCEQGQAHLAATDDW